MRIYRWNLIIIYLSCLDVILCSLYRVILASAVKMKSNPYLCILFTLSFPTIALCDDLDIILRKLEQLEYTQKHEMRQMRKELDNLNQELTSTRAELDLMKHSAVQSSNLLFSRHRIRDGNDKHHHCHRTYLWKFNAKINTNDTCEQGLVIVILRFFSIFI